MELLPARNVQYPQSLFMAIISNGGVKYQLNYILHVSQCQIADVLQNRDGNHVESSLTVAYIRQMMSS